MKNTAGYWRGRSRWSRLSRSWSSRSSSWSNDMVVVVRAGDGAAAAVLVDRERDVPRPRPRAAPRLEAAAHAPATGRRWHDGFPARGVRVSRKRQRAQPRQRRAARRGYRGNPPPGGWPQRRRGRRARRPSLDRVDVRSPGRRPGRVWRRSEQYKRQRLAPSTTATGDTSYAPGRGGAGGGAACAPTPRVATTQNQA